MRQQIISQTESKQLKSDKELLRTQLENLSKNELDKVGQIEQQCESKL